jgi:hypothetical protein
MAHHPQSTASDASGDRLEILMELARQASPADRLRIERTIRIVREARQAVAGAHLNGRKAEVRLRLAMDTTQRVTAETARQKSELQILRSNILK